MEVVSALYNKFMIYVNSPEFLTLFLNNRFYMILLVVVLMRLKYGSYQSLFMSTLVNIPGTLLHESSHFLVGMVMNAQPTNFTLIPRKTEGGYIMGSVGFRNVNFYNAVPSAMAPLLLLPIGFYLNRHWLPTLQPSVFNYMSYILLQTVIIENALPSGQDFKVAFSHPVGVVVYSCLAAALLLTI